MVATSLFRRCSEVERWRRGKLLSARALRHAFGFHYGVFEFVFLVWWIWLIEQALHPVLGVWLLVIKLVSANFQQAWHQIPDAPGFAATHFRQGIKFGLGVAKIAEAKSANPAFEASVPCSWYCCRILSESNLHLAS